MMKQILKKLLVVETLLLLMFVLSCIAVNTIPTKNIAINLEKSAMLIVSEGRYPQILGKWFLQLDNYTDGLMLNLLASTNSLDPIKSAFGNYYYASDFPAQEVENITQNKVHGTITQSSYSRYWHGYQCVLRPLLLLMDYKAIRIVNYCCLFLLLLGCFYCTWIKIAPFVSWALVTSLMVVCFPIVPLSIQFSSCFYILLISILVLCNAQRVCRNKENLCSVFFVIGACCAFFDYLTTPLITLGIPLIYANLLYIQSQKTLFSFILSFLWGIGYGVTWASKWVLSAFLGSANSVEQALDAASNRSSWSFANHNVSDILFRYETMFMISLFVFLVIVFAIYYRKSQITKVIKNHIYLFWIACLPVFWMLFMFNHTIEHFWFTYRIASVVVFALVVCVCEILNKSNHNEESCSSDSML